MTREIIARMLIGQITAAVLPITPDLRVEWSQKDQLLEAQFALRRAGMRRVYQRGFSWLELDAMPYRLFPKMAALVVADVIRVLELSSG